MPVSEAEAEADDATVEVEAEEAEAGQPEQLVLSYTQRLVA